MPRFELIHEDVTSGRPGQPGTCPIARSIVRAGYIKPRVTGGSIRFTDPETGVRYAWTSDTEVRRFITEFDNPGLLSRPWFKGSFPPWAYSPAAFKARQGRVRRRRLALLPFSVDLALSDAAIVGRPPEAS